jgi:hypothetical protein
MGFAPLDRHVLSGAGKSAQDCGLIRPVGVHPVVYSPPASRLSATRRVLRDAVPEQVLVRRLLLAQPAHHRSSAPKAPSPRRAPSSRPGRSRRRPSGARSGRPSALRLGMGEKQTSNGGSSGAEMPGVSSARRAAGREFGGGSAGFLLLPDFVKPRGVGCRRRRIVEDEGVYGLHVGAADREVISPSGDRAGEPLGRYPPAILTCRCCSARASGTISRVTRRGTSPPAQAWCERASSASDQPALGHRDGLIAPTERAHSLRPQSDFLHAENRRSSSGGGPVATRQRRVASWRSAARSRGLPTRRKG